MQVPSFQSKPLPVATPQPDPRTIADLSNPFRKITLYFGLALLFIRCSLIHQTLTYQLRVNLYLLYVIGIPAIFGIVMTGGLRRPFRFRPAYYLLGFALWLTIAIPFSIWRGGSFSFIEVYWRTDLILLFALGGLAMTWEDYQAILRTMAAACVVTLITVRLFGQLDVGDRVTLQFGSIANSNDYPGHILTLLPALLWLAMAGKLLVTRVVSLAIFVYGLYTILASGSRGALVAVVVGLVYFLIAAPAKQRIAIILLAPVFAVMTFSILPDELVRRIFSFSDDTSTVEAKLSKDIRARLLGDSIKYTLEHPLFGVGPGNFSLAEGTETSKTQAVGLWFDTHNSYTQVASECGIPGLILFLAGLVSSFLGFRRAGRQYRDSLNPKAKALVQASFCMRLMLVSFCTAITFLNFAYFFYLPMIGGLAIAMLYAAKDLDEGTPAVKAVPRPPNSYPVRTSPLPARS